MGRSLCWAVDGALEIVQYIKDNKIKRENF